MSPRTFARRFKAETGATPHDWLVAQRVLLARQLLEETVLGVDAVAVRAGFGTAAMLRHHFTRRVGATPVFIDIDPVTYNLSTTALEHYLTESCRHESDDRTTQLRRIDDHLHGWADVTHRSADELRHQASTCEQNANAVAQWQAACQAARAAVPPQPDPPPPPGI